MGFGRYCAGSDVIDTGAAITLIPERLAHGLERGELISLKAVGGEFKANKIKVHLSVGPIDKEVEAVVVPDDYTHSPLLGMNIGPDDMYNAISHARQIAKQKQQEVEQSKVCAVQTRAQAKREREQEMRAAETRTEEQPDIKDPEEIQQTAELVEQGSVEQVETAKPGEADGAEVEQMEEESAGEPETQESQSEDDSEDVLAEVISTVDAEKNLGVSIPAMELGTSMVGEYKEAVEIDDTLSAWKSWGREWKNGFKWDDGMLKRMVEDDVRGNREILVIPKGMRFRMMRLVHEQLGHVGSGKMLWSLRQNCCWPGMDRAVKSYGRVCVECQRMRKAKVGSAPMGEMQIHKVPFEHVSIDIVGPFPRSQGYKYLLTYICLASRYPEAIPLSLPQPRNVQKPCWKFFPRMVYHCH